MQCSCGGATAIRTATHKGHALEYQQCPACGRVGGEMLFHMGQLVERGLAARQQFNQQKEAQHG